MKKTKIAYVRIERELGESFYFCSACKTEITQFIKRYHDSIWLKHLKHKSLVYKCPGCKKILNWSKVGFTISISKIVRK